jgi:hypothetical protein
MLAPACPVAGATTVQSKPPWRSAQDELTPATGGGLRISLHMAKRDRRNQAQQVGDHPPEMSSSEQMNSPSRISRVTGPKYQP